MVSWACVIGVVVVNHKGRGSKTLDKEGRSLNSWCRVLMIALKCNVFSYLLH